MNTKKTLAFIPLGALAAGFGLLQLNTYAQSTQPAPAAPAETTLAPVPVKAGIAPKCPDVVLVDFENVVQRGGQAGEEAGARRQKVIVSECGHRMVQAMVCEAVRMRLDLQLPNQHQRTPLIGS